GAATERLERPRTQLAALLLDELAVVLAVPLVEPREDHVRGFGEALATLLLVDAETLELDATESAPDAEDEPAVREVIEHDDLLSDPHRIVPRQHDDHRAELQRLRTAREVCQVLQNVRTHRV